MGRRELGDALGPTEPGGAVLPETRQEHPASPRGSLQGADRVVRLPADVRSTKSKNARKLKRLRIALCVCAPPRTDIQADFPASVDEPLRRSVRGLGDPPCRVFFSCACCSDDVAASVFRPCRPFVSMRSTRGTRTLVFEDPRFYDFLPRVCHRPATVEEEVV